MFSKIIWTCMNLVIQKETKWNNSVFTANAACSMIMYYIASRSCIIILKTFIPSHCCMVHTKKNMTKRLKKRKTYYISCTNATKKCLYPDFPKPSWPMQLSFSWYGKNTYSINCEKRGLLHKEKYKLSYICLVFL